MQLKYPFFVGGINLSDFCDIDLLASRGEAMNGVLKEAILTLDSAVPAKMFRAHMRCTCACLTGPQAPPPGNHT